MFIGSYNLFILKTFLTKRKLLDYFLREFLFFHKTSIWNNVGLAFQSILKNNFRNILGVHIQYIYNNIYTFRDFLINTKCTFRDIDLTESEFLKDFLLTKFSLLKVLKGISNFMNFILSLRSLLGYFSFLLLWHLFYNVTFNLRHFV